MHWAIGRKRIKYLHLLDAIFYFFYSNGKFWVRLRTFFQIWDICIQPWFISSYEFWGVTRDIDCRLIALAYMWVQFYTVSDWPSVKICASGRNFRSSYKINLNSQYTVDLREKCYLHVLTNQKGWSIIYNPKGGDVD